MRPDDVVSLLTPYDLIDMIKPIIRLYYYTGRLLIGMETFKEFLLKYEVILHNYNVPVPSSLKYSEVEVYLPQRLKRRSQFDRVFVNEMGMDANGFYSLQPYLMFRNVEEGPEVAITDVYESEIVLFLRDMIRSLWFIDFESRGGVLS